MNPPRWTMKWISRAAIRFHSLQAMEENSLGNPFIPQKILHVNVAHYPDMDVRYLEGSFFVIDNIVKYFVLVLRIKICNHLGGGFGQRRKDTFTGVFNRCGNIMQYRLALYRYFNLHLILPFPDETVLFLKGSYHIQIEFGPGIFLTQDFKELLGLQGVGAKTLRALSLISELVHGVAPSYRDPARYSFAHGGKDGIPYPVDRQTYDKSIDILRQAVQRSKLGVKEKNEAVGRLGKLLPD